MSSWREGEEAANGAKEISCAVLVGSNFLKEVARTGALTAYIPLILISIQLRQWCCEICWDSYCRYGCGLRFVMLTLPVLEVLLRDYLTILVLVAGAPIPKAQ